MAFYVIDFENAPASSYKTQIYNAIGTYNIKAFTTTGSVVAKTGNDILEFTVLTPTADTVYFVLYEYNGYIIHIISKQVFTYKIKHTYPNGNVTENTFTAERDSANPYYYSPNYFGRYELIVDLTSYVFNVATAVLSLPAGKASLILAGTISDIPTDPYSGAGDSTTGGGDGTFDGSSDPVPVPSLPSVGAQDSGFITLFAPTAQQMKDLAHFMWVNPVFDLSAFKKLFADPMDCILELSVVPVTIPTSGAKNVNIGNLVTSVTMNVASQQYIEVDCGTVAMDRFFGSYLDFEPYTKISIFLPYCGTHALSMDDIAGKTIGVVYHIDILTGSCIAFVKCGDSVLYEFNGACGSNIPVNSLNFASTIENAIRIAVNIGTTVATAGASAPITGTNAVARETARKIGTGVSLAGSTAEGALSMKPNVSRSGALGGGVGILGHQIPYLIITRPRLCKPAKQDFFQGYPSFIQTTIGDLIGKGFTSFTNVIISGQYLTDEEETELESILESGVYL